MPELPEAETIAADLRRLVVGRRVAGTEVVFPDILASDLDPASLDRAVRGRVIERVGRRGKNVVLTFREGPVLVVNLGMTGRLVTSDAPRASELRHVAARFALDSGRALLYDDTRRFGRLQVLSPREWAAASARLGPEPLDEEFTGTLLHRLASASRTPIRNWLLDQRRVAGVGNIYANEALFRARIHPARPADTLAPDEAARLRDELRNVLGEAIAARGTTFSDYRDGSGERGGFEPRLLVYGREGLPCPGCNDTIRRSTLANRSMFHCPACQPELRRRRSGGRGARARPRR